MHIRVRVKADQKIESIEKIEEDRYAISVKEKAERNNANNRALDLLSETLKVPKGKIKIITGHHMPNKIMFISN